MPHADAGRRKNGTHGSALRDPAARFGFLASLCSGFGQTYFIGLFGAALRQALGLSAWSLGLVYGAATLASGASMFWFGAHADRASPQRGITLALGLLALGCGLLGSVTTVWLLLPAFFALRLGGQGLSGHYAIVTASRMASSRRGRGVALATFGFIVGEALWPNLATRLLALMNWRWLWWAAALTLLIVLLPLSRRLAAAVPPFQPPSQLTPVALTRLRLLRTPSFHAALGVLLVSPVVISAFLFQQTVLSAAHNWRAADVATAFLGFAGAQAVSNLATGRWIDRFGVMSLPRLQLLPLAAAMLCFSLAPQWGPLPVFAGLGATNGINNVCAGLLWPALFGERQLGLVRGVYAAIMVAGTALSPALLGWALDAGLSPAGLALMVALYAVFAPLCLQGPLRRQVDLNDTAEAVLADGYGRCEPQL